MNDNAQQDTWTREKLVRAANLCSSNYHTSIIRHAIALHDELNKRAADTEPAHGPFVETIRKLHDPTPAEGAPQCSCPAPVTPQRLREISKWLMDSAAKDLLALADWMEKR